VEEILVHAERAVQAQIKDMIENRLNVFRLAIGREPHDLVLAGVHLEPGVIGEGGIEQTERMRKVEFLADLEIIAVADGERRGAPLPYSVEGENRRLFERRGIEGRCRVRQMM